MTQIRSKKFIHVKKFFFSAMLNRTGGGGQVDQKSRTSTKIHFKTRCGAFNDFFGKENVARYNLFRLGWVRLGIKRI